MLIAVAEIIAVLGEHQLYHIPAWSSFCIAKRLAESRIFLRLVYTAALTGTGRIMRAVGRKARRARVGRIVMSGEASAEMLQGDGIAADCEEMFGSRDVGRAKASIYLMV